MYCSHAILLTIIQVYANNAQAEIIFPRFCSYFCSEKNKIWSKRMKGALKTIYTQPSETEIKYKIRVQQDQGKLIVGFLINDML